jgi:RNA polymerase sigma-70 factor (ECF subfamily)
MAEPIDTRTSLIARIRDSNDNASWTEFVGIYAPLIRSIVRRGGVNRQAEEDVVQEVFTRVASAAPTFQLDYRRGRFGAWLWTVARHTIADHFRAVRNVRWDRQECRERVDDVAAPPNEPDENWLREQRMHVVRCAMDRVRETAQEATWTCFQQHVLDGRPAKEVGDSLGISANSVYVNASRVLAKIRQQCADYMEELDDG